MSRKQAREKAFQTLYQIDINKDKSADHLIETIDGKINPYASTLIEGVINHLTEIDTQISEKLEKWSFNRVATVEKTVLRIAVYEILYEENTPNKVAINEAVELAKKYNEEQSGKFINGVLSKFMNE